MALNVGLHSQYKSGIISSKHMLSFIALCDHTCLLLVHSFIHESVLSLDNMLGSGHNNSSLIPKTITLIISPFGVEVVSVLPLDLGTRSQVPALGPVLWRVPLGSQPSPRGEESMGPRR